MHTGITSNDRGGLPCDCDHGLEALASTGRITYTWPEPPPRRVHGCDVPGVPFEFLWLVLAVGACVGIVLFTVL